MVTKTIELTADMPEGQAASVARQMFKSHLDATDKDLSTMRLHGKIGTANEGLGEQWQFLCDIEQPFNSGLYNTIQANKIG